MEKPIMKSTSVQVPISLYRAVKRYANEIDSNYSKECRQALKEYCKEREIDVEKYNFEKIDQGDDPLAEALKNAGIGLDDLGEDS